MQRRFVNTTVGKDWDRLRWFLAAHYKFNLAALDTRFLDRRARGVRHLGARRGARALRARWARSLLPRAIRQSVLDVAQVFFYGLAGLDCILLGQKVPHAALAARAAEGVASAPRPRARVREAPRSRRPRRSRATWAEPASGCSRLVDHPTSWVAKGAAYV